MPSSEDWVSIKLGDVCLKIGSGATPRGGSEVYLSDSEYALIRSQNVYNEGFRKDGLAFISEKHAAELDNVEVLEGDVLLNITGDSVARACQVDSSILPARVNQHVAIIRPDPDILYPRFLRYSLISPEKQAQLLSWAGSGGTRKALTKGMIESLEIWAPVEVADQRAIAFILGTLDDKVELNCCMNSTLEAVARAIFKSWFVDFDPVYAKLEGRDPGVPAHIADMFPDRLVDSELGEIPEGWMVGKLGDLATNPRRSVRPEEMGATTPYIGLQHMPEQSIALSEWGSAEELKSNKYKFHGGEILFGKLRPYFHKVGIAPLDGVCSTDIVVIKPKQQNFYSFTLAIVSSKQFVDYATAGSTGTKMPRTSWREMARYEVVIPSEEIIALFESLIQPIVDRIVKAIHESKMLSRIRDTLLPKLISGELRVEDPEAFLERVM
jgi:type I restriction enzyme S subunit